MTEIDFHSSEAIIARAGARAMRDQLFVYVPLGKRYGLKGQDQDAPGSVTIDEHTMDYAVEDAVRRALS